MIFIRALICSFHLVHSYMFLSEGSTLNSYIKLENTGLQGVSSISSSSQHKSVHECINKCHDIKEQCNTIAVEYRKQYYDYTCHYYKMYVSQYFTIQTSSSSSEYLVYTRKVVLYICFALTLVIKNGAIKTLGLGTFLNIDDNFNRVVPQASFSCLYCGIWSAYCLLTLDKLKTLFQRF